jgi:cation transport ATPase
MQGCLDLVVVALILAALKSIWDWLANSGAVSIGSVLLWVVIVLVTLYIMSLVGQYFESLWGEQKQNRLRLLADASPEAKERCEKYLEKEQKRLQRLQEFQLDLAIKEGQVPIDALYWETRAM